MEVNQRFRILYYLDNESTSIIEIKRLDIDQSSPVYKLYYWLFWDKTNDLVEPLSFVSMTSSIGNEERVFKQGSLSFDEQEGNFTTLSGHQYVLERCNPVDISAANLKLINDFLDSMSVD